MFNFKYKKEDKYTMVDNNTNSWYLYEEQNSYTSNNTKQNNKSNRIEFYIKVPVDSYKIHYSQPAQQECCRYNH